MALHAFYCLSKGLRLPKVPWLSWVFVGLAGFAYLQSIPTVDRPVSDNSSDQGASISMQRWALGFTQAPRAIASNAIELEGIEPNVIPCDLQRLEPGKLAWSVEPIHTRAAVAGLLICALMTACGAIIFSSRRGQLFLFLVITITGVAVGCFGLHGAFSYQAKNLLELETGGSFACFKSKNSAGGFLNVCLAGSIGLLTWTLMYLRRKKIDIRYRFTDENIFIRVKGLVEDFLSDLSTPQIAALLCTIVIVVSLLLSQCRGAAIGGLVGLIGATIFVAIKDRSGSGWIAVAVLLFASVGCMLAFQIDENALERLESLSEFDLQLDAINGRTYIWSIAWKAMQYYGLWGSGLGTFHFAYLPFQDPSAPIWFYHAESLFFQCGVELGWIGLGTLLISFLICLIQIQRGIPTDAWKYAYTTKFAGGFLLVSQFTHSVVDFALILPALFIPGCLLLGACMESIKHVSAMVKKSVDQRERADSEKKSTSIPKSSCIQLIVLCAFVLGLGYVVKPSLDNLAATERLDAWVKSEEAKPRVQQDRLRLQKLLGMWSLDSESLKTNPHALKLLADSCIFEFRINQLAKASKPVTGDWSEEWPNTRPVILQAILDREKTEEGQERALEIVQGKAGTDLLEQASDLYARAHSLSPLDWRLCWGRIVSNLGCSRQEMSRLLSPAERLARHYPQQMMDASVLFRKQLSDQQIDQIWKQTMRTNPAAALKVAKMIVNERDVSTLDIGIFPQRWELLEQLARNVFTKDKYPELNGMLWERAKASLSKTRKSQGEKYLWLANAAREIGDVDEELFNLGQAYQFAPMDIPIGCRYANRLIDTGEFDKAKSVIGKLSIAAPSDVDIEQLKMRLKQRN
jgi:tetratricopeptide (TPR) repeat protein